MPANYCDAAFLNVGHHPPAQNLSFTTPLPADKDSDNDLSPTHKILETVAHRTAKVAGALCASQSSNGKCGAIPPLGHTGGKKQHGRTSSAHNYSSEDIDAVFNILEETLPLGGHAWNSVGDAFNT